MPFSVIPAKAGIQCFQIVLDACLRRHDGILDFLQVHQNWFVNVILWLRAPLEESGTSHLI
jgi:hypothetical protein